MTVAAVVVSLAERHTLLAEAVASVYAQTRQPDDLVIGVDYSRRGEVWNQNRLIDATDCDWLAFLHDDDLWDPDHLEVCAEHFETADVVVSRFRMTGRPENTIEPWHTDFADLRWTNWIGSPSMVCVRRDKFGWWREPCAQHRWVDWCNYNRLLDDGARFADTGRVTTTYRFTEFGNGSWGR